LRSKCLRGGGVEIAVRSELANLSATARNEAGPAIRWATTGIQSQAVGAAKRYFSKNKQGGKGVFCT